MARMSDGFVFITKVSGPKVKDGKAFADVTIDERELVMCRSCEHWDDSTDGRYVGGWCFCDKIQISTAPDWFCADGERGDESDEDD